MRNRWATTGALKRGGELPVTRAARLRRTPPTISAWPRWLVRFAGHVDLCGWVPAVLMEWPGTRLWLHPEADPMVTTFEAAREEAEAHLRRLRKSGKWPAIVRDALSAAGTLAEDQS